MKTIPIAIVCLMGLQGCNGDRSFKKVDELKAAQIADSIKRRNAIDHQMSLGERPDSEQDEPSFAEVKAGLLKSYNEIKTIDTLVIDGKDSLHVHFDYYCLHDSALIVPKKYNWGEKHPKDLITHNFATKFLVINRKDTIFNKIIKKSDFNGVIDKQLRAYAILFDPGFNGYNKAKGGLIFGYSISIPLTDVGVPAYLFIDKNGNYKTLDEYAFK